MFFFGGLKFGNIIYMAFVVTIEKAAIFVPLDNRRRVPLHFASQLRFVALEIRLHVAFRRAIPGGWC